MTLTLTRWLLELLAACGRRLAGLAAAEDGQGLTEYALIIALVAVVVIGAVLALGHQIVNVFTHVTNCLGNTSSC